MSTEAIDTGHPGLSPVAAEAVAMGSMAMVAGAAGVASFLHAGLSVEAATSVSVLALSAFMANHLIMSRPTNARSNRQPRTRD
jgi:hypothetical protein